MNILYFVSLSIGSVLALIYVLVLLLAGTRYDYMINPLDKNEYKLKEIYAFGFAVMNLTRHNFSSKAELKRRSYLAILKEKKYADYYLQVEFAKRVSYVMPIFIAAFIVAPMAEEIALCPVILILGVAIFMYLADRPKKAVEERSEELLSDFADVVSKLALLINSGMIMSKAWERVAYSSKGVIYDEMQKVAVDMRNGVSEADAYGEFGNRCIIPEIKKFASTIVQGSMKANRDLAIMLTQQSSEVWETKMNLVRRKSATAETKLMFPMLIMFLGIIVMVVLPIISDIGAI